MRLENIEQIPRDWLHSARRHRGQQEEPAAAATVVLIAIILWPAEASGILLVVVNGISAPTPDSSSSRRSIPAAAAACAIRGQPGLARLEFGGCGSGGGRGTNTAAAQLLGRLLGGKLSSPVWPTAALPTATKIIECLEH